jgi:hypothetical protein
MSERAEEPAFWFGFEVARAKLAVGRVLVFALLAVDALAQIRHAPRYGAGGFNVAQLPGLDAIAPGRDGYAVAQLVLAYLFALVACGAAVRVALPIATIIYAWLYLSSQLDSYQHHYLVAIVLAMCCFVPWNVREERVRAPALRLVLVELGIVYLWAAISKLDARWLDGSTLDGQIHGATRALVDGTIGVTWASRTIVAIEFALAATVWWPRAWKLALPLGVAFHVGIALSGLDIGLFAWLMVALYAFVVPDAAWTWLARRAPRAPRSLADARWLSAAIAMAVATIAAFACRFEHAGALAIAFAIVPVIGAIARRPRLVAAHAIALVGWLVVDRASPIAYDYYRYWGGIATQLDDRDEAELAYYRFVAVFPDEPYAHLQLGRALLARGDGDAGLRELHAAQQLEPARARAYLDEARWLAKRGRAADALRAARAALHAEPDDRDARALVKQLGEPRP